jgi:hypothetical protein
MGCDGAREVSGNRIGNVDDRLAVERIPIVHYRRRRTRIRHTARIEVLTCPC